jgi:hypothetical protein
MLVKWPKRAKNEPFWLDDCTKSEQLKTKLNSGMTDKSLRWARLFALRQRLEEELQFVEAAIEFYFRFYHLATKVFHIRVDLVFFT